VRCLGLIRHPPATFGYGPADELRAKEAFHTMVIRLDDSPSGGTQ
jgi:hypothetical protein